MLIKMEKRKKKEEKKGRKNYRMGEGGGRKVGKKKKNQSVLSPWLEFAMSNSVVCALPPYVTSHTE